MTVKITLACTECKQRNYNQFKERVSPIIGIRTQVSGFAFKISSGIPALSFPNIMKQSGS